MPVIEGLLNQTDNQKQQTRSYKRDCENSDCQASSRMIFIRRRSSLDGWVGHRLKGSQPLEEI